jgi:hypothetical protein
MLAGMPCLLKKEIIFNQQYIRDNVRAHTKTRPRPTPTTLYAGRDGNGVHHASNGDLVIDHSYFTSVVESTIKRIDNLAVVSF